MSTAKATDFFPATVAHRAAMDAAGGVLRRAICRLGRHRSLGNRTAGDFPPPLAFAQAPANQLQDMQVQTLPGNKIELELKLSGAAPTPLSFTIENPARIALDLPNTALALPARRKDVGVGALTTILAAEADGRTRVVLNLELHGRLRDPCRGQQRVRDARRARRCLWPAPPSPAPPRPTAAAEAPATRDRRLAAASRTSISAAARMAAAGSSSTSPMSARRWTCVKKPARSC